MLNFYVLVKNPCPKQTHFSPIPHENKSKMKTFGDSLVVLEHRNNLEDFYGFEIALEKDKIVSIASHQP